MERTLTCEDADSQGLVGRYLARTLTPEEEARFEAHYLTCDRCQAELRLGMALRAELPPLRPTASMAPLTARRPWRNAWAWGAGTLTLLAAGLAAALLVSRGGKGRALERLGLVSAAPPYSGVQVRSAAGSRADSLFDAAMAVYAHGDHTAAASGLRAALAAGADPVPADFFLGASLLLAGRPEEADAALGREIALGESPYASEAYYYRAKALLRLRRADEALRDLAAASGRPGPMAAPAAALADSVKQVLRR